MHNKSYAHITFYYKKLNKLIVCLTIILFSLNKSFSQQFNNWYFPLNAGLNFNTNPPTPLTNGAFMAYGTSACISDNNGNLLFYTNGVSVWNRNHQQMPNGFGLFGLGASSNSAIVIPFRNKSNFYYIFTADGHQSALTAGFNGYNYSIVDMNADNGFGDVVSKNNFLYKPSGEKLCAIQNKNGNDIWLITRDWKDTFRVYNIGCSDTITNPVISVIGTSSDSVIMNNYGEIKANSKGDLVAVCSQVQNFVEIFKFNNETGKLSNCIKLPIFVKPIGLEFSPSSKFLYISAFDTTIGPLSSSNFSVYQLDISIFDSTIICNSLFKVGSRVNVQAGGLQLASDNKIYVATSTFDTTLGVIANPDNQGLSCNFIGRFINLGGKTTANFLPYAPTFLFASPNVQIPSYTVAPDCRTVTLTGKTYIKGNNLTFKWKFGDGDSTVQIVPSSGDTTFTSVTHFFPLGIDTFNVQLFVTSDTVCGQGSAGKKVVVKPPKPTAKFGFQTFCNNTQVNFTDSSLLNFNPSLSYKWQFFTKQNILLDSSVLQNTSYTFPTLDTFKVRLIVRSALACVQADTLTKTIVLKAKPIANFSYTNNCGSLAAAFTNTSTVVADTLSSYYWNFGDGNIVFTKNPNHNYAAFGNYIVKLVVTSSLGCVSDTFSLPVSIKAKPVANFIYSNNGCAGLPVLLQDSAYVTNSSIATHYWQLPNGNSFNTVHINPTFAIGGSYSVKYVVASAQGCVSDTLIKSVFIESIPVAAIAPVNGGCVNEVLNFTSNSSMTFGSINQYKWKFTNTDSVSQQINNTNFTFTSAGNYNIEHQVQSSNGCVSNTAITPITIHSKPIAVFSNGLVCLGKQVSFLNESINAVGAIVNSEWLVGNGVVSNNNTGFDYTFNQGGNYLVSLKVTTANGCSNTFTKTIAVEPAIANAGKDTIVREGEPFVLNGSGGISYVWQPPIGLDDVNKANPIGILNNSQQYNVKITTAQGCVGFDTVMITVLRNLKIPNAFSPNGDGMNETWNIEQLKDYSTAEIQIFNRNGQLLYSAKGNNIAAWNGTINNKPVPVGTYYYVIILNNQLRNKPFTGWVLVVR